MRLHLREWATHLAAGSDGVPILVRDICSLLGIAIAKDSAVPPLKAYLSLDPTKDIPAKILLPKKSIGSFERFCIAHELAHYLLHTRLGCYPDSKSEYWKHEDICDEFARNLLLPDAFLSEELAEPRTSTKYLVLCADIADRARIPWIQAALRIVDVVPDLIFFRCESNPQQEMRLAATTLRRRKGQTKIIPSPLRDQLGEVRTMATVANLAVAKDVTDALMACDEIVKLMPRAVMRATAEARPGKRDVKFVVRCAAAAR
jgi:hypothetical protein